MNRLLRNAMKTPDGTIIESQHRHDYVTHLDANGETYMVDGGLAYLRRSLNIISAEDLSIESIENDHGHNRQHFTWGTYGKDGDQPLKYVALMNISTNHIKAILRTQILGGFVKNLFTEELKYRVENSK